MNFSLTRFHGEGEKPNGNVSGGEVLRPLHAGHGGCVFDRFAFKSHRTRMFQRRLGMIRTLALTAALSTGFAFAAYAGDAQPVQSSGADSAAFTSALNSAASADAARKVLIGRGYTQVSDLSRGPDGRWTGTAMKDGKIVMVGVELPPRPATSTN
jgi:hypothetical protein